jgi:hypothetical protein
MEVHIDIPDWNVLAATAEFDPNYLMLDGPAKQMVA